MSRAVIMTAALAAVVSGCTQYPRPLSVYSDGDLKLQRLVRGLQCELAQAYEHLEGQYPQLKDWRAGVDLTLKKTDQASLAPSNALLAPITNGVWGLAVGGSYAGGAATTQQLKFRIDFKRTGTFGCKKGEAGHNVNGSFGFYHWINQSLMAAAPNHDLAAVDTIAEIRELTVDMSGGITPSIMVVSDRTSFSQQALVGGSQKSVNTLALAVTKIPDEKTGGGAPAADRKIDNAIAPLAYPFLVTPR